MPVKGATVIETSCYAIQDDVGDVHLVDPGANEPGSLELLLAGLRVFGCEPEDVRTVTATHFHHDHLGLAFPLAQMVGAKLVLSRVEQEALVDASRANRETDGVLERWQVPVDRRSNLAAIPRMVPADARRADRVVDDGDDLDVPGRRVVVMATPGHTGGHICLRLPADDLILTGDHVLEHQNSAIGLGGSGAQPLIDMVESLWRTARVPERTFGPGHGLPFFGGAERSRAILSHLRRRNEEVQRLSSRGELTVWDVAQRLTWSAGWSALAGVSLRSALTQTEFHMQLLAAFSDSDRTRWWDGDGRG